MKYIFILAIFISRACFAQDPYEKKAQVAGAFYAAVIMTDEIKKGRCSSNLKINESWRDVAAAKREIYSHFPTKYHAELTEFFSAQQEKKLRKEFADMYSSIPTDKCKDLIDRVYWPDFDKAVRNWQAIR